MGHRSQSASEHLDPPVTEQGPAGMFRPKNQCSCCLVQATSELSSQHLNLEEPSRCEREGDESRGIPSPTQREVVTEAGLKVSKGWVGVGQEGEPGGL